MTLFDIYIWSGERLLVRNTWFRLPDIMRWCLGGPHAVKYICIYRCVYVHTCMYMYIYMCIYMYGCMCVNVCLYTCIIIYFIYWLCLFYGFWHLNSGWWFDRTGIYIMANIIIYFFIQCIDRFLWQIDFSNFVNLENDPHALKGMYVLYRYYNQQHNMKLQHYFLRG